MTAAAPQRIILVGCVKTKRTRATAAKDLYASPLWRGRRAYAERSGEPWFILSALHGLVRPDERVEPYNLALADLSARERRDWGARVTADLQVELGTLAARRFEIHAGAPYRDALLPRLRSVGADVAVPLAGLPLGRQLQWYRARS
jgi:hypothetical protein